MIRIVYLFIVLFCVALATTACADEGSRLSYDYLDVAIINANPDYSPFEDGIGYGVGASKALSRYVYLAGSYHRAVVRLGGEIRSQKLSDCWNLGSFVSIPLGGRFHVVSGISAEGAVLDGKKEEGFSLTAGFRSLPLPRLEMNLSFSYLDLYIKDIQTIGEVYYHFSNRIAAGVRIRDYGDWDYTSYEAGMRWSF